MKLNVLFIISNHTLEKQLNKLNLIQLHEGIQYNSENKLTMAATTMDEYYKYYKNKINSQKNSHMQFKHAKSNNVLLGNTCNKCNKT